MTIRLALVAVAAASLAVPAPGRAAPATHTLCVGHGCHASLAGALAVARDGDTIRIAAGRFAGGVTITRSVRLVGAGPRRTTIQGGGPVVTVAPDSAGRLPTVAIRGLVLTGGHTVGNEEDYESYGGGLAITYLQTGEKTFATGPTVRLTDVVVAHNDVSTKGTYPSPSGVKCPGPDDCPYARARGGGIASYGNLTLVRTQVFDNRLDGRLSDAEGGGVFSAFGDLTLIHSSVTRNAASPAKAIARYAEGGGLFVDSGNLHLGHTDVSHNSAVLRSDLPVRAHGKVIEMSANGGGIHVGGDVTHTVIASSTIDDNTLVADAPKGEPVSFDPGVLIYGGSLRMSHTTVARNHLRNRAATDADGGFSGTAMEVDGSGTALITDCRIVDNTAYAVSTDGPAGAGNGLGVYAFFDQPHQAVVRRTLIARNTSTAVAPHGQATVLGAGLINNSLLRLDHVRITGNTGTATGPDSLAQGGGIWNGVLLSGPPVTLALLHSMVDHNRLVADTTSGGGVYTQLAFTRTASTVTANSPDQVVLAPTMPERAVRPTKARVGVRR